MLTILYFRSYNNFNATRKLAGIHRFGGRRGWNVQVIDTEHLTSQDSARQLIAFWKPAGILVEDAAGTCDLPLSTFGRVPTVFIDRNPRTLSRPAFCVTHDSAADARLAARELMSLNLASYAYVPWRRKLFWCREREAAFRAILRANGKSVRRFSGRDNAETMLYAEEELMDWLRALPRPAGVFAANDYTARQVISAANHAGLSIPDDLAVVGVDDEEIICEHTQPTLTSVRPDFERAGELAAQLLQRLIDSPRLKPRTERFGPTGVIRRESTRRLQNRDQAVAKALEAIRLRACEGLTAKEVLTLFPVARRMAEIRFRKAVGHSILDEIQRVRIERAKELLRHGDVRDLTAVANFCGYASASVLYKLFMGHVGRSPRDWRDGASAERPA